MESTGKPSWRELLGYAGSSVPHWYEDARNADDEQFWDAAMGEGFNDWYLKSLVESAKPPESANPPPQQLDLPGFESIGSETSYPLNSF